MTSIKLSDNEIVHWTQDAKLTGSISQTLRRISENYKVNKFDVASLAADIFEEGFSGEDMQVLWKWDMANQGEGFSDKEIDSLLEHLLPNQ